MFDYRRYLYDTHHQQQESYFFDKAVFSAAMGTAQGVRGQESLSRMLAHKLAAILIYDWKYLRINASVFGDLHEPYWAIVPQRYGCMARTPLGEKSFHPERRLYMDDIDDDRFWEVVKVTDPDYPHQERRRLKARIWTPTTIREFCEVHPLASVSELEFACREGEMYSSLFGTEAINVVATSRTGHMAFAAQAAETELWLSSFGQALGRMRGLEGECGPESVKDAHDWAKDATELAELGRKKLSASKDVSDCREEVKQYFASKPHAAVPHLLDSFTFDLDISDPAVRREFLCRSDFADSLCSLTSGAGLILPPAAQADREARAEEIAQACERFHEFLRLCQGLGIHIDDDVSALVSVLGDSDEDWLTVPAGTTGMLVEVLRKMAAFSQEHIESVAQVSLL